MNDPIVVTRTLVKRAWSDIEPKIVWALVSGTAAEGISAGLHEYGVTLPPLVASSIPLFCALLAGYLAPSVGTTVTRTVDTPGGSKREAESHSGNTVSVFTAPTAVQPPAPTATTAYPAPSASAEHRFAHILGNLPSAKAETETPAVSLAPTPYDPNKTDIL